MVKDTNYNSNNDNNIKVNVDGFILGGMCPSSLCRYVTYDVNANNVGRDFMTECEENEYCASKFGGISPYDVMQNTVQDIYCGNQTCINKNQNEIGGYTKEIISLGMVLFIVDFNGRVLIPPLIYRMNRCIKDDVQVLSYFLHFLQPAINSTFYNSDN